MDAQDPQYKLEDTQPIPVHHTRLNMVDTDDEQRDGRIGRTHEGIRLLADDGVVYMTHAEWREYAGHEPHLFPGGTEEVRRFFDEHTIKPNDNP